MISFLFLSFSLFSLFPDVKAHNHQLVFEEIGELAPSVSYLHVSIPLDLTGVKRLLNRYGHIIDTTFQHIQSDPLHYDHTDFYVRTYWDKQYHAIINEVVSGLRKIGGNLKHRHWKLSQRLDHITKIMPFVQASPDDTNGEYQMRYKRSLPFLLAKGLFGTFMGLYNRRQYSKLKDELRDTIQKQNRLITWSHSVDLSLAELNQTQRNLLELTDRTNLITPISVVSHLQSLEMEIVHEIDRIHNTVQHAQLRRLSVSLLPALQLNNLFRRISHQAESLRHEILISNPSDLFQIETSYFFDGSDITLIVHVPIAPARSVLRLQKLLPFPLSFSDTHFLTPRPLHNMFAISSDEPRMIIDLSEADLEGCYKINSMHLCERLGVLSLKLERSCLGSLYTQQFKAAMSVCNMEIAPVNERVLQLNDNWFLVYTSKSFMAHITCANRTGNEIHLKTGVNKILVSPSCSAKLQDHLLYGDSALREDSRL